MQGKESMLLPTKTSRQETMWEDEEEENQVEQV